MRELCSYYRGVGTQRGNGLLRVLVYRYSFSRISLMICVWTLCYVVSCIFKSFGHKLKRTGPPTPPTDQPATDQQKIQARTRL